MNKRCTFCDHPEEVCRYLFVKDDIGICDRCIQICNLVMGEPAKLGAQEYDFRAGAVVRPQGDR